jgi:N-acetylmuramoyl-L-alanine amidase
MTMRLLFLILMATLIALPAQAKPLLKLGSQGVDVLEAQALLQLLGYYEGELDGTYTEATEKSVNLFQKIAGLNADGILGTSTWNKLLPPDSQAPGVSNPEPKQSEPKKSEPKKPEPKKPEPKPAVKSSEVTSSPILRRGAKSDAVYRLQKRLVNLGFLGIAPDGDFGDLTEKAVKAAQQKYKLEADGVVGGATWNAIGL